MQPMSVNLSPEPMKKLNNNALLYRKQVTERKSIGGFKINEM